MKDHPIDMPEGSLDPSDWEDMRAAAHRMVDEAVAYVSGVRERPVWQEMPQQVRDSYRAPLPVDGRPIAEIQDALNETLMPYPMGNVHPRFWMWFMGSSNFTGAMGDFIAAILGSNLGGGNHAAALMDRQVVDWMKEATGFPADASGTLVSGGSVANLIALTVARNEMARGNVRRDGVAAEKLRFYTSDQVHSCHQTAMETLGLGDTALCRVPSRDDCTMDTDALRRAIAADRMYGYTPAAVIATAGTVNTGAVDDLDTIAEICRAEGLWMHVDGCIGALVNIAPANRHRVAAIARADSLALDPHKWLHAPFEVGCCLVKNHDQHLRTFTLTPEYLETRTRGIAAADFLHDYGIQTSRGFRALKVWMALQEHGTARFGALIDRNIAQAELLGQLVRDHPRMQLIAPVGLNITCFRYDPGGMDDAALKALNIEIMLRLQETGQAAISDTTVQGRHCLRAAIVNHRTTQADIAFLVEAVDTVGRQILDAP